MVRPLKKIGIFNNQFLTSFAIETRPGLHLMNICYCCFFSDIFWIHFWKVYSIKNRPNFCKLGTIPCGNFLWTCEFLTKKKISDFVSLPRKLHNHNRRWHVKLYLNCVNGFSKTKQKTSIYVIKINFSFYATGFMQE